MNMLSKLILKYDDSDDPIAALDKVQQLNYDLMRQFPSGVPSGVMFGATALGQERMSNLLIGMIIDLGQVVHGWDEAQAAEQEGLSLITLRLIAADTLHDMLKATAPHETNEEDSGE